MSNKIMAEKNLDNIYGRLSACLAMFYVIHADMDDCGDLCDAMYGACDLLKSIMRDFQADLEAAEDYECGKEAQV